MDSTLKQHLKLAKKMIQDISFLKSNYGSFDRIYPFSNENLADCFDFFDIKNKNCLSIMGSCDQALELYSRGAKTVTTFDCNPLTEYYGYLKIAAILSEFSNSKFLDFFSCESEYPFFEKENSFSRFQFLELKKSLNLLSSSSFQFWGELLNEFDPLHVRIGGKLFNYQVKENMLPHFMPYLQNENYEHLILNLKDKEEEYLLNFIHSDILDLNLKLKQKYDFIYLSNIMQYTSVMYPDYSSQQDKLKAYRQTIEQLSSYLQPNGKIVIGYLYAFHFEMNNRNSQYISDVQTVFPKTDIEYLSFPSIEQKMECMLGNSKSKNIGNDVCLVYTKK